MPDIPVWLFPRLLLHYLVRAGYLLILITRMPRTVFSLNAKVRPVLLIQKRMGINSKFYGFKCGVHQTTDIHQCKSSPMVGVKFFNACLVADFSAVKLAAEFSAVLFKDSINST